MASIAKIVSEHSGVRTSLTPEQTSKVFLHTVGTIASAQKFELFPLAECLGLCFVTPIIRNLKSVDPETVAHNAKYLYEPKFRYGICVACCLS
jgi:hypothetical protein